MWMREGIQSSLTHRRPPSPCSCIQRTLDNMRIPQEFLGLGHDFPFYHTMSGLSGGQTGLIIDPGSMGNLSGDFWAREAAMNSQDHRREPTHTLRDRPLQVTGVGRDGDTCTHNVQLPCVFQQSDGTYTCGEFDTPTLRDSLLPGLLGLTSLKQRRAILDMVNNQLHFLGPGDFDLARALPPGTETYDLQLSLIHI